MSTVINVKDILIGFSIKSIDMDSNTCELLVSQKRGIERKVSKLFTGVKVSNLLKWNLINNDKINEDTYYEDLMFSRVSDSNPFQLIKYTNKEGVDEYMLYMVFEAPTSKIHEKDVFGKDVVRYKFNYHKRSNFKRYRDYSKK